MLRMQSYNIYSELWPLRTVFFIIMVVGNFCAWLVTCHKKQAGIVVILACILSDSF